MLNSTLSAAFFTSPTLAYRPTLRTGLSSCSHAAENGRSRQPGYPDGGRVAELGKDRTDCRGFDLVTEKRWAVPAFGDYKIAKTSSQRGSSLVPEIGSKVKI